VELNGDWGTARATGVHLVDADGAVREVCRLRYRGLRGMLDPWHHDFVAVTCWVIAGVVILVTSDHSSGCGPSPHDPTCSASSNGLLSTRTAVPSRSPSGVIRTITLRRRCRSIPTHCPPPYSSTGASFVVVDVNTQANNPLR
jgi:hypothetical protein